VERARRHGASGVGLETNRNFNGAIDLYRSAGYV